MQIFEKQIVKTTDKKKKKIRKTTQKVKSNQNKNMF